RRIPRADMPGRVRELATMGSRGVSRPAPWRARAVSGAGVPRAGLPCELSRLCFRLGGFGSEARRLGGKEQHSRNGSGRGDAPGDDAADAEAVQERIGGCQDRPGRTIPAWRTALAKNVAGTARSAKPT